MSKQIDVEDVEWLENYEDSLSIETENPADKEEVISFLDKGIPFKYVDPVYPNANLSKEEIDYHTAKGQLALIGKMVKNDNPSAVKFMLEEHGISGSGGIDWDSVREKM